MTDNVVEFPGGKIVTKGDNDTPMMSADEAFEAYKGQFESVIMIGIKGTDAKLVSTVELDTTMYELSRAMHILHRCIDSM